jgi:hypothetical protein
MNQTKVEKNKRSFSRLLTLSLTNETTQRLNATGPLTTFNTALISGRVVRVCSTSSRASHRLSSANRERSWLKET